MKVLQNKETSFKKYVYESYSDEESSMFNDLKEMSEWLHTDDLCLEAYREYYKLFLYLYSIDNVHTQFNMEFELDFGDGIKDIIRVEKR